MTSYAGRHAELYDLFYADKSYTAEARFVDACLRRHGKVPVRRVLEIACGTGSHAFELEKIGYSIVASDSSEDMLAVARRKAKERRSSVDFHLQDNRSLELAESFDAVICLFDSIGYVVTDASVAKVLQGVHAHLKEAGLFVFEFWHAPAMLLRFEPVRVRRFAMPDRDVVRISETLLDPAAHTASVTYTIFELCHDRTWQSLVETQTNRFFTVQEMTAFLAKAGFIPLQWLAGYTNSETVDDTVWHIVAVARKQGTSA